MIETSLSINKIEKSRVNQVDFANLPFGKVFTDHMYVADYKDGAWGDFRIEEFANLSVHPANIAWHYGQSIFEGMKATISQDGTPMLFRPEMHSERINKSAERLCMPAFPKDKFVEGLYELVKLEQNWIPKSEGSALYLRPFMVAMDEFIGVQVSKTYKFIIFCCPVGPYYSKNLKLKAETKYIRAAQGGTGYAKAAGNYAGSLYPTELAKTEGFDQILWLDAKEFKYCQEVGTMNIFFVIGDTIITPSVEQGTILRGITKDSLIHLLKADGHKVEERLISIDEVVEASNNGTLKEIFGAGTAAVVANVEKVAYKEHTINLDPSTYKVSPWLKDTINGIRSCRIDDRFGWTVKVV